MSEEKVCEEGKEKDFVKEYCKCKAIEGKEEKMSCLLNLLHDITELQDVVNITTFRTLDDDTDPRWYPLHIIDNANAVILGISRNKGYPELIVREGYVDDKVSSLKSRWDWVKRKEGGKNDVVVD